MKYKVPASDGECLFHPPREEVSRLIESNHSLLASCDFKLCEMSFGDLRSAARRRIAEKAGRSVCEGLRIVVGAHQPGFHGPGILYKHKVLQELSQNNLSVNFVVDSDVCSGVSVRIPYRRGQTPPPAGLKELTVFPSGAGGAVVFENLRVPPKSEVDQQYDGIENLLKSLETQPLAAASPGRGPERPGAQPPGYAWLSSFRDFRAVHDRVYREGDSAAKTLTRYRQGYCPTPGVSENAISEISRSDEFLLLACDVTKNIEKFHEAYNSSLREHRAVHGIRNPANPFPDLHREAELWELPFWGLDDRGGRRKLYARGERGKRCVLMDKAAPGGLPPEPEALASLRIRPRAVCLTMFLRLFVGDLFVHGVGGGNYDQVTDRTIRACYGVSAPAYVVCSRTKFPSGDRSAIIEREVTELRQRLRQMEHNPEGFVKGHDPLAEEARRMLSQPGHKLSREQHARLRDIRRALSERIKPQIASTTRQLVEMEEGLRREAVLHRRDFPYFLYPRSAL